MKDAARNVEVLTETSKWPVSPLGEIVDVLDSRRKPITKRDRVSGPYPYFGATGVLDWVEDYLFDEPLVLIGEDGAKWGAGDSSAFAIDGKTWVNNHAHVLRPHRNQVVDDWLIYYLNATDLSDFISGMTVPKLNQGRLREIPIPLPPLEEQKRIVAVLDQAFAALDRARAHAEANLLDLDDLILSASRETFDALEAEWRPLGSLCEIYQPKTISAKEMSPDGEYVVFGANGKIGRYHAYNHAEPQLLVTCRGATCGQINISEPFSWITGNAMVVRPKDTKITSDFLEHFFRDAVDWDEVITGAAQPQITRQSLSPVLVPVPALKEQDAASEKLGALRERVETLILEYKTKLDELADLRQSLLQKAFSGQLTA
ncbi:restriction endonuclease subunit S [Paracoccus aurantiacus]|nr:restriction endonuclease subunit S [Paracoccus aurantiacus]